MTRWLSLTCLTVLAFAQATGPLASFESDADQPFAASGARLRRVAEHATAGQSALEVVFPGSEKDSWPGIILRPGANRDWSQRDLLVFDAFLAGTEPVRLGVRLDSDGAEGAFDAIDLRPGLQRGVKVSLKGFSATANLKVVKQLLLYVGKPRQDITVWLDNVRWDTAAAQLARIVHVETRPTPAPTVDQVKCGFMLFARSYLAMVFPDDRPTGPISRLELVAARGEREPVSLSVYALHDLAATISISNLAGPHGAKLPATAWDIRRVECLAKRLGYSSDQYVTDVPSYLAPADGLTAIGADRTRTFQLTLAAPPDAVPGVYVGRVTVQAGDLAQAVPLRVRILPYNLPEPTGLLYGEYYRKFGRYTQTAEDFRRDLADMRAQGMTSLGLCVGIDPKSYTVSGDQVTFHWTGDTAFEWIMQAYVEQGFPAPVVMLSDSGQEAAAAGGGEPGQARYDAAYLHFHQALAAALKAKGWPELYIQPVDEASWQSVADQQRNLHLLGLLHRNGIKTEVDGPPDKYLHELAGPLSDIWTCNGRIGPQEVVDAARAAGRLVTNYNNDVESWTPEADRWAYGLFNWRNRLDGGFNWEYRGGSGDLYDDLDGQYGDFPHRYPAENGRPGGPATGWEGSREGIDDRRFLLLTEQLITRGQAAGGQAAKLAAEARADLDQLRLRLDADRQSDRMRARFSGLYKTEQARALGLPVPDAQAKLVAVGDRKLPNGLTYDEYDSIRWLAASHAWRLAAALGETKAPEPVPFHAARVTDRLTVATREKSSDARYLPRPVTVLPTLAVAPKIDGVLDGDPGWTGAASLPLTLSDGSGRPDMATTVRCGLVGDKLYVAFECAEDRIDRILANVKAADGPVWEDDCVEVFIDPSGAGRDYRQVLVNSLGTVHRLSSTGQPWKPDVTAAAAVDRAGKRWLAELAIPVGDLHLAPRCGLNFGRERRPFEAFELSTWSVTGGGFGQPERFGLAVRPGAPLTVAAAAKVGLAVSPSYQTLDEPTTRLTLDLGLPAEALAAAKATVTIAGGRQPLTAAVPGKLAERVAVDLAVGDLPAGSYRVTVTLSAPGLTPVSATAPLTRLAGPFDFR